MKLTTQALLTTLFSLSRSIVLPHGSLVTSVLENNSSIFPISPRAAQWGLPRPAGDALWNGCRIKGCNLLEGMVSSDKQAGQLLNPPRDSAQSPFRDFPREIAEWGYQYWDVEAQGSEHAQLKDYWGVEDALKGLGVSTTTKGKAGHNELVYYTHFDPTAEDENGRIPLSQQTYEVDRPDGSAVTYPYTGAYFLLSLNPKDGVIMTMNRKSPTFAARDYNLNIPPDKFPALSASSDVAWGMWTQVTQQNNADIKNIRYFLALSVTNPSTMRVASRALNGANLEPYPGKQFWLADEAGKALMGTPNGVGMGFFLMQHKAQLGRMAIFAINVFHCSDKEQRLCLLFHVSRVDG